MLDSKIIVAVFIAVFIAELGDKTQLATLLFASDKEVSKLSVFVGASVALIVTTAIAVTAGSLLADYINLKYLNYLAGFGFIGIGLWTLTSA